MEHIVKLTKYQYDPVFKKLSIKFEKGKITAVSGTNNCGKTTLIKAIAGLLPVMPESISFHYVYIESIGKKIYRDLGIFLPHENLPFICSSVYKELAFPLENLTWQRKAIKERIKEVTSLLEIDCLMHKDPKMLSIVEKRKVELALAIIHKPKVLLLDDPFTLLNEEEKKKLWHILKGLQEQEGTSIIYTTSNLQDTLNSDYLYILNKGKIVLEGTPLAVMKEEKIINRLGLEIPFMVDLSSKLIFYELLDEVILDMDRMVDVLWK